MYTTTITKSNQITLTKPARDFLGVQSGDQVTIERKGDELVLHRRLSDEEFFAKLDDIHTRHGGKRLPRIDAVKAVRMIREGKSSDLNEYYRKKYQEEM